MYSNLKRSERSLPYYLLAPAVAILLAFTIYPLVVSLLNSFSSLNLSNPSKNRFVGVANYFSAITDPYFLTSVRVTLVYTLVVVAIEFVLGFFLALLLNQRYRGAGLFRVLLLIPVLLTPAIVGMVWRILYNPDFGMINYLVSLVGIRPRSWLGDLNTALPAAALVDIWQWTPFMMLLLLAGLRSLPRDPFEAALIDGASQLRILIQITVPMLSSVITVALLIRTIDTLRIFDQLYILTSGGPGNSTETLSLFVYKAGLKQLRMGYASAVSYLMLIIAIIISTQLLRLTAKRS